MQHKIFQSTTIMKLSVFTYFVTQKYIFLCEEIYFNQKFSTKKSLYPFIMWPSSSSILARIQKKRSRLSLFSTTNIFYIPPHCRWVKVWKVISSTEVLLFYPYALKLVKFSMNVSWSRWIGGYLNIQSVQAFIV